MMSRLHCIATTGGDHLSASVHTLDGRRMILTSRAELVTAAVRIGLDPTVTVDGVVIWREELEHLLIALDSPDHCADCDHSLRADLRCRVHRWHAGDRLVESGCSR